MNAMSENDELAKLVDGAYKNILEKFNPCARQLISAGKAYLKALHGAVAASKAYIDALGKLARHAHQGTWGGCTDIGTALLQLVDVHKEIQSQQLNILKAFYVDLLVPLETNIDKDTKVVACEQKRFIQQHKCLQESYLKAVAVVKKQKKKNKGKGSNIDNEIRNLQQLEEEKMKLDCFCERSLKQAITQERRRYGFVLERQCSLTKHNLVYHSQGQNLLQHNLEEWEEVARSRECLPDPIDKLFPTNHYKSCSEYASANILDSHPMANSLYVPSPHLATTLRKTRSIDASCVDLREAPNDTFPRPLIRAKSDFNIASSNASLISNDYGITLRPKSLAEPDSKTGHSRVRALYSYLSSGEHQLSFHEGDIIVLIGDRNKGWQYGENTRNHRRGWFPIAYTAVLDDGPNVHPMENNTLDLKRRSVDLSNPYSTCFGVSRSRTTPNIQPFHNGLDQPVALDSDFLLPPPPPNAQRPLSTFLDSSVKNMDSLQLLRTNAKLLHAPPSISSSGSSAPSPTSSSSGGPVTSGADPLVRILPRRLPPMSTSLHSSNDSGFCNDTAPPAPVALLLSPTSPGFSPRERSGSMRQDEQKPKENMFSSVKLRKVITNDRSAPMIS
ncbi:brain-specific angiogenesis inhibitor 1-associated protein 2-like isoform X2 [Uloborus diversus]|uniref:brain-specific angiogenesis inhibitor 1-associated protein 2-like isoform X1 n=1 Tax=Uloborus diversus TaxID=327109 RepID=UPI002409D30B|nr:brain-specific angiogenesis inhibitor 1-associated protein 2-like isoform X1 [Uloborus diversus]XP_054724641.1 brain-specific angiogenesis inhibitor 1-associated protein 2-like isoform X2 [Uloborus diversus]